MIVTPDDMAPSLDDNSWYHASVSVMDIMAVEDPLVLGMISLSAVDSLGQEIETETIGH